MVFAKLPSLAKQGVVSHASILRRWSQQQIACFSTTAGTTTTTTTNTNASTAANDPSVVLYQYAICPFCNITKAVLSFSSVKYKTIEVNPLTKAELQNFSKDYRKVPIAMVDDVQVNGSDKIVDKVLQHPTVTSYLQQKLQNLSVEQFVHDNDSQEWLTFARDELSSLLYPNICRTWRDSYQAFGYVHNVDTFSTLQKFAIQTVGSLAMYFAASKIKQKRNITDERQALHKVLLKVEKGLGSNKYLSGKDDPHLGDIAMYGTLRSIEGLPVFDQIIMNGRDASSPLPDWYKRMKEQVGN